MTESTAVPASVLDWERLRAELGADAGLRPVGIRDVLIGAGALGRLRGLADDLREGRPGVIAVLRDTVAKRYGTGDLHAAVLGALDSAGTVRQVILTGHHGVVHADEATTEAAVSQTAGAAMIVTVGSGTLADLGKMASAAHGVPHVVVQTAASVNGFADDQSVLLRSGVKRTVASRWPDALIVDANVLAGAPLALNRAGVGDLLSMFTAPADWLLASVAGFTPAYVPKAVDLVRTHGDLLLSLAPGIAAADPSALALLAELLTLSGVSMGVAGCTSPSSGMEHLVSHMLDMHSASVGRASASHGSQVGVGSVVAAATWARVRAAMAEGAGAKLRLPDPDDARAAVESAFLRLDPTGRTVAECWTAYSAKMARLSELEPSLRRMLDSWQDLDIQLDGLLKGPAQLLTSLRQLGAATRFSELQPGHDRDVAEWAITNAPLMRDRFTVADLAGLLGLGGPAGTEALLSDLEARVETQVEAQVEAQGAQR